MIKRLAEYLSGEAACFHRICLQKEQLDMNKEIALINLFSY